MQFSFGEYVLDPDRRELRRGSESVAVEPQVFDLLDYLVQNRSRVVSKDDLIAAVWGGRIISESTLTSRINAVRKAVGDTGREQSLIRTYARKGIRFVGEVHEVVAEGKDVGTALAAERIFSSQAAQAPEPAVGPYTHLTSPAGPISDEHPPAILAATASGLTTMPDLTVAGGKPTIAVLPFNNMSGEPEQEYFSDGITEDIITLISKNKSLFVIARNSTFAFKGHGIDVRRAGKDLGADYILEGAVRKVDRRVRISAQLIETEAGRHVWADRYDRDLEDIFQVQDEITATIAATIEPEVGAAERLRAEHKPPQDLHAWDWFHLGTKRLYSPSNEDNLEAQRIFRRAIELDPTLARAYANLSYAIVLSMVYFEAEPDEGRLSEAVALAKKAVDLDDRDALIRFAYGRALLACRDYRGALAELQSAVELNPSLPVVYCGLGDSLAYEGRFTECFPYFEVAINLSRFDPQRWAFYSYRSFAHLLAREFQQALDSAQKAVHIPNCHYWPFAHRLSAIGHLQLAPQVEGARAELLKRKPGFSCSLARRRLFYIRDPGHLELYIEGLRAAGIPE